MKCPSCRNENLRGADACEHCGQDLTAFDAPGRGSELANHLLETPVSALSPRPAVIVPPETPIADVVARLCERRIGCVLVGTQDEVQGIFSERDVLLRVAGRLENLGATPVSELMTRDPETLELDAPIAFALNRMSVGDFRHLPVTRDGELLGVVSLRDVLRFLSERYPDLIPSRS